MSELKPLVEPVEYFDLPQEEKGFYKMSRKIESVGLVVAYKYYFILNKLGLDIKRIRGIPND